MTEKHALRQRGEDAAARYLERVGTCVFERNWRCSAGTIDILAWDGDTLVVVDVKTRASCRQEEEGQAVSAAITHRIETLAGAYIDYADLENVTWRYDLVDLLVLSDDRALLRHYRDALNSVV